MAGNTESALAKAENILDEQIDVLAKDTLYVIARHEIKELAKRDPSFEEIVQACKKTIVNLEEHLGEEAMRTKIVNNFVELVGILASIAQSIVDYDEKLLIDCCTHLEEFLEIRANGGKK